jgi:ribonuclease HI
VTILDNDGLLSDDLLNTVRAYTPEGGGKEFTMAGSPLDEVVIYTDGACDPNPGPGGWGAVILRRGAPPEELSGSEAETTNNRMEMRAALEALRALPGPARVELFTDSQYLVWGMNQVCAPNLFGAGGVREGAKNGDLWGELAAAAARHRVVCRWVEGHAGNRWNERAHELAGGAVPPGRLPLDDDGAVHLFSAVSAGGPAPGGWAVLLRYRAHRRALGGSEPGASANRLHVLSALRGVQALKKAVPVHLYTTSEYLRGGATGWVAGWRARGWQTAEGRPVSHRDLWEALVEASAPYAIRYHLVRDVGAVPEMQEARRVADGAVRGAGFQPAG